MRDITRFIVNISAEAERYARKHGLFGSLRVMKSLVLPGASLIKSIDIDLVQDPETTDSFLICFSVDAVACVSDVLEFDRRLRDSIFDAVPADDRAYFAVRFDFA
jgi:hypothetical protein